MHGWCAVSMLRSTVLTDESGTVVECLIAHTPGNNGYEVRRECGLKVCELGHDAFICIVCALRRIGLSWHLYLREGKARGRTVVSLTLKCTDSGGMAYVLLCVCMRTYVVDCLSRMRY